MPSASRRLAGVLLAGLLGACSSGGSDDGPAPVLIAATFVGQGATPAAGDYLLLETSADVQLNPGALLDDTDVTLSAGTLGGITLVPTLTGPRTVRVTLGAGASLQPGSTTIAFAATNDAVRGTNGVLAGSGPAATIVAGDGDRPQILSLTIENIDGELNGTGLAGGRLQTPRTGFRIDLTARDLSSAVDPARTALWASVAVAAGGLNRQAGVNLAPDLLISADADRISLAVPTSVVFAPGDLTVTATVTDTSGMVSTPLSFAFRTIDPSDSLRPLEDGQLWFLDTSRDVESYDVTTDPLQSRIIEVSVDPGANGRPDLEELMLLIGLQHGTPLPNVAPGQDSNQAVMTAWQDQMVDDLERLFDGADVAFTFSSPGTFPSTSAAVPYADLHFAQICIAGAATEDGMSGTLGAALFDVRNQSQENDCLVDFQGMRLGVFLHTAVRYGMRAGASSAWRTTFDPFTPAIGGTPIGADRRDGDRLSGALSDNRTTEIQTAIFAFGRLAAVVTAHECGHSMGLVANGPMPQGLYGGDPVNFPLSRGLDASAAQGHIQNTNLFPPGSQNVMSPAIDFESSLSPSTAFNSLNRAYLRERALYNQ